MLFRSLVSAEADVLQSQGDTQGAAHRLGHALGLLAECQRLGTAPHPEVEELLRSVRERLAPRA